MRSSDDFAFRSDHPFPILGFQLVRESPLLLKTLLVVAFRSLQHTEAGDVLLRERAARLNRFGDLRESS